MTNGIQLLHVRVGSVENVDYPAREGRPARVGRRQNAVVVWPESADFSDMGSRVPFALNLRDGQEPYDPAKLYQFPGLAFKQGQFGRLELNGFAELAELPAVIVAAFHSGPVVAPAAPAGGKLSEVASAKVA